MPKESYGVNFGSEWIRDELYDIVTRMILRSEQSMARTLTTTRCPGIITAAGFCQLDANFCRAERAAE